MATFVPKDPVAHYQKFHGDVLGNGLLLLGFRDLVRTHEARTHLRTTLLRSCAQRSKRHPRCRRKWSFQNFASQRRWGDWCCWWCFNPSTCTLYRIWTWHVCWGCCCRCCCLIGMGRFVESVNDKRSYVIALNYKLKCGGGEKKFIHTTQVMMQDNVYVHYKTRDSENYFDSITWWCIVPIKF